MEQEADKRLTARGGGGGGSSGGGQASYSKNFEGKSAPNQILATMDGSRSLFVGWFFPAVQRCRG